MHRALAALPRPRKHYQWYYSTREADGDMTRAPQGVHDFLRAYYHHKSADWTDNKPYPLQAWSAEELAKLPTYYVMDLAKTMPETVATVMPSRENIAANTWLPDSELAYYAGEYSRTGFQGGLQWYRCGTVRRIHRRVADLVGPQHRRALLLHLRPTGLGHPSARRRLRGDADEGLQQHDRLPPDRRRRPLGAAGAAGGGQPAAARISPRGRTKRAITTQAGTFLQERSAEEHSRERRVRVRAMAYLERGFPLWTRRSPDFWERWRRSAPLAPRRPCPRLGHANGEFLRRPARTDPECGKGAAGAG